MILNLSKKMRLLSSIESTAEEKSKRTAMSSAMRKSMRKNGCWSTRGRISDSFRAETTRSDVDTDSERTQLFRRFRRCDILETASVLLTCHRYPTKLSHKRNGMYTMHLAQKVLIAISGIIEVLHQAHLETI